MTNRTLARFGLLTVALSVAGAPALADGKRSPLRGVWSFSQQVPSTTLLTGNPIPLVAVGTLTMSADNSFTGHGVFNTPVAGQQAIELDMHGSCGARNGRASEGFDCVFNFPAFGLSDIHRYCVAMDNARGRCFDSMRCVNIDEPGSTVALVEYRRQNSGTCD